MDGFSQTASQNFSPSAGDRIKVYCAGPLFNASERTEMTAIADALVLAGFDVYLPHRDGMEFRLVREVLVGRGFDGDRAGRFLHEAIFALDVYQLAVDCQAMVWNLNGRVPDEGAVSEAAIAWTLGKPLVAYHDDARSLIAGRVNPLLVGLVNFETLSEIGEIPTALQLAMQTGLTSIPQPAQLPVALSQAIERGEQLWTSLKREIGFNSNEQIADCVTRLFA